MCDAWLADIVVVNESRVAAIAGDVSVYRSAGEACRALEHWWIEGDEGAAFTASGERLTLGVTGSGMVSVTGHQAMEGGPGIVRGWLQHAATAVLEARRAKAPKGKVVLSRSEEAGQLPASLEGLIAYVGFND
jgi:hypothetical protein